MRKLKLLFAALALLVGGLNSAKAQSWTDGEYVIRNVGTGTYLKGDCYWGTKAVVWNDPYFVTLTKKEDGVYSIKSQQNNGGSKQYLTAGDDPYMDGDEANMTFNEVDAVNHYYTINNGNGNLYAVETTEDGATLYKVMPGEMTTDYAKWQVISRAELVAALDAASPSNPVEATFFIKDAGIDVKSVNASSWTTTNVDLGGGGNAGHSAESWNKSNFNMSQTVTGLPNGKYRVTCHGYYRWNGAGGGNDNSGAVTAHGNGTEVLNAIFFAGTKETPLMSVAGDTDASTFCSSMSWADNTPNNQWQAAACFTKGYYLNTLEDVVVTDGTLTLGVKKTTQAGTDWAVFDEFKLYYLGEDISIYVTAYNDAVTEANAVDQSAPMLATALSALKEAISNYGTGVNTSDKDALLTATSALTTATTNATTSIAAYAAANTAITKAEALQTANNFVTSAAATTFAEAIANIKTPYTNGTLSNADATAAGTTLGVVAVGWHAAATNTPASNYIGSTWGGKYTINDWSVEGVSDGSDYLVPFFQNWTNDGNSLDATTMTGTLEGLSTGTYKVSAWVRVRAKNETAATDATGITMDVNGGEATDVTEGTQVGTTQFQLKEYEATGYVLDDGVLNVNFNIASGNNISWLSFKNISYTRTGDVPAADADDYTALAAAITATGEKVAGFESGEYAPYNNIDAFAALAAAKAINPSATNVKSVVQAATTALNGATWTANATDVECVYNGNFALGQGSAAADIQQYGWTRTNGWGQFKNDGYDSSTAYYNQPGSLQYGNAGVYTMPLKAQTIYRLQFKYAKWDGDYAPTASVLNGENGMAAQTFANASSSYKDGYNSVDMLFVTAEAGNYVLSISGSSNYVITGVSITKAASQVLEFTDGSVPSYAPGTYPTVKITRTLTAGNWATAVYPFAVSGVDKIAVLDSYNKSTGALGFTTATESTANVPFLMRSTADKSEISLSNVEVAAAAATDAVKNEASLKGVYAATTVDNSAKNYVLSNNVIYPIGANSATVNPYRAYIQIAQDADPARGLTFTVDGETTAIDGITAGENAEDGAVYNLQGQRVVKAQKGLYIKDGRKVMVK